MEEYINFADFQHTEYTTIQIDVLKSALDLINRQEAEIERLQAKINHYNYCYENFVNTPISHIKAKAYEEFVELSKSRKRIVNISDKFGYEIFAEVVTVDALDNLYKGLVGDDNE